MRLICAVVLLAVGLAACAGESPQEMQFAKEQRACGELGLDPGEPLFSDCVADLDATMFGLNSAALR